MKNRAPVSFLKTAVAVSKTFDMLSAVSTVFAVITALWAMAATARKIYG